tara:strand:+ start:237 stop:434 length:198 start_codon:yes stop_codon:yes gene_type:complete
MTIAKRGKISFIMPDSWTEEQGNNFADKIIEQVKPKIIKLKAPDSYTTGSIVPDKDHKRVKEEDR